MDRNSLDWLFSTLPQALAAFVGLVFAGVTFILNQIDDKLDKDDSLTEIIEEIRTDIHRHLLVLFILSGLSITLDSIAIFFNPVQDNLRFSFVGTFDLYYLIVILLFGLNIVAFIYAFSFILEVANPKYLSNTVEKMSAQVTKDNKDSQTVDKIVFVEKYILFERDIRERINSVSKNPQNVYMSLRTVFDRMRSLRLINQNEYLGFRKLNHARNLYVHGGRLADVPKDYMEILKNLHDKIKEIDFELLDL